MASKSKNLSAAADLLNNNVSGAIRKIPISQIQPSVEQPRLNKDINIEKLSKSLIEEGLLQPIVVTKKNENTFTIIAGERRYRAAMLSGWTELECKILNRNEVDTFRLAVIENLQREELNPVEESYAYKKLKNLFSYTDQQLSEIIGKSRNYISEILSIADIPEKLRNSAYESGIKSRNLLVQFAQAVKNNQENEFLINYKNGNISTVKSAKSFLKLTKEKPDISTDSRTHEKKMSKANISININSRHEGESQIQVDIKISNLNNTGILLSNLENFLKQKTLEFFSKNMN